MGLDMYLFKKISLIDYKADTDYLMVSGRYQSNQHLQERIPLDKAESIRYQIGYWRKANHIHSWFVNNVQDSNDDCGSYYVSKEKLEELLNICKEVLAIYQSDKTFEEKEELLSDLLPTQAGFFFGGLEYDDYYIGAVEETIEIIEREMASDEWDNKSLYVSYVYESSW